MEMVWSVRLHEKEESPTSEKESHGLCNECGSNKLIENTSQGEVVCEECGLVIEEELVDSGPEWRAFDHQENQEKSRVGAPLTESMHDRGLATMIDWRDRDASGKTISPEKRGRMHRLRKWQKRIQTKDAEERNLQFALSEIDRMASSLGVPQSVREVASVIYRRSLNEDLIRGRSIEAIATAALYSACRQEGIPRNLEEMTAVSRIEQLEISRAYRYISKELNLELQPVNPKQYVPRFCSELELSEEVQLQAIDIIEKTADPLLSGRGPTGFAAAAIYAATLLCNEKRTQEEVAEAAHVTSVTIRNRYKEQIEMYE